MVITCITTGKSGAFAPEETDDSTAAVAGAKLAAVLSVRARDVLLIGAVGASVLAVGCGGPRGGAACDVPPGRPAPDRVEKGKAFLIDVAQKGPKTAIYVATRRGMFVSTDQGRAWSRVGAGYNVSTLDPHHPKRMVAPTFRSLLTTSDGGANWRRAELARCATPLDGAKITSAPGLTYAWGSGGISSQDPWFGGIFRSTDAGRSFKRVGNWDPDAVTVDPSDPKTLYAATQDGLFKSTSAGDSWDHIGDKDTLPYWQVVVSPSNPEVVYAVADGHRFLDAANGEGGSNQLLTRSTDGGKSWKVILDIFDIAGVAVGPQDPNTIYVDGERINPRTGVGVFMVSHDGGTTWQTLTKEKTKASDLPTVDPNETQGPNAGGSLFVDPTDPNILYQQRLDAVGRSTDGGRTFQLLHPPD